MGMPAGIPLVFRAEVTELAGVWDYPRVLWLYPKPPRRVRWLRGCVQFQLCGFCVIPAAWLRCGALQGSTFPKHRS